MWIIKLAVPSSKAAVRLKNDMRTPGIYRSSISALHAKWTKGSYSGLNVRAWKTQHQIKNTSDFLT
jgi:hypothetical protein